MFSDQDFHRIGCLPPYVFKIIVELRRHARSEGKDVIDFGMGNPDQLTPKQILEKLIETSTSRYPSLFSVKRYASFTRCYL